MCAFNSDQDKSASKVRSFRIDTTLDKELVEATERDGITLSSLFNIMVKNYLEFARVAIQMNRIILSPITLLGFLKYLTPEQCKENGLNASSSVPRQALMIGGKPLKLESIYVSLEHLEKAGWFKCVNHTGGDRDYFYIQNSYGQKWRSFLEGYLTGLIRLLDANSNIEALGDNLILQLVES